MNPARAIASPARLKQAGILGMNCRNHLYIGALNPRALYPRVDDKLKTKLLLKEAGIAAPRLIGCLKFQHAVKHWQDVVGDNREFVLKPAKGAGGKGIVVVTGRDGDTMVRASGEHFREADMQRHLANLLSGLYSLGGQRDVALFEERIHPHDDFEPFSYRGIPDVRIIVYRGCPVMAMIRLSTRRSDGKANLHQGAVGVGLDIGSGRANHAVLLNRVVDRHPDTGIGFGDLTVPQWEEHLLLATRSADIAGLGYLGADIILDPRTGPLVLELNARPGLAIQTANRCGLRGRLDAIDRALPAKTSAASERVALARTLFGGGD